MNKETPILFSTEMVKAILEGRKTMTRRIVKIESCFNLHQIIKDAAWKNEQPVFVESLRNKGRWYCKYCGNGIRPENDFEGIKCPYGKEGDVLWVKETFAIDDYFNHKPKTIIYKTQAVDSDYPIKWKPSLFMPKEAARIWLEITDVKVERLQDISEEDAINEGIEDLTNGLKLSFRDYLNSSHPLSPIASFKSLWQKINGPESWQANPFVWVVSFKVLSTTGKPKFKKLESVELCKQQ